jgi:hypothetical protein
MIQRHKTRGAEKWEKLRKESILRETRVTSKNKWN